MEGRQLKGKRIVAINIYSNLFAEKQTKKSTFNIYKFDCLQFGTTFSAES